MKRVNLCDNRLRPESVGEGEKQSSRNSGRDRACNFCGEQREHQRGQRSIHSRREVHCVGRLPWIQPREKISESVVEGVGLARRQVDETDAGLECGRVAEIEARQQRGVVARQRHQPDDHSRQEAELEAQPFSEPGSGGAERGASLVSIG